MKDNTQIIKQFRETFIYKGHGIWHRKVDGYIDEDDNFVKKPHEAYAVPDFMESFLTGIINQVEKDAYQKGWDELKRTSFHYDMGKKLIGKLKDRNRKIERIRGGIVATHASGKFENMSTNKIIETVLEIIDHE